MISSRMDGWEYKASRFAATLRRRLFKEHLGLLRPQACDSPREHVTSYMRCAPVPNEDETRTQEDDWVLDPLADGTLARWNDTARVNREIFTEVFRPLPSNLVRSWSAYEVRSYFIQTRFICTSADQHIEFFTVLRSESEDRTCRARDPACAHQGPSCTRERRAG